MQQPTQEQLDALRAYAAQYGRTWKARLRHAWETGQRQRFKPGLTAGDITDDQEVAA